MSEAEIERLTKRLKADAVLESAARQLQDILIALASEAEPLFPYFPNSEYRLVEVEPGVSASSELGFVALCPDGLLYELSVGLDLDPFAPGRRQGLRELSLPPPQYIPFAYNAICQVTEMLNKAASGKE